MNSDLVGLDPLGGQGSELWTVNIEGEVLTQLRNRYTEITDKDWNEVVRTAAYLLGNCPPAKSTNMKTTGLAIGKVQSGKTLSYSVLSALAFDNGYAVVLILAGTKTPLLEQTYSRLTADLVGGGPIVTPFKNPTTTDSEVLESIFHNQRHALIVILKRSNRISRVREIFEQPSLNGKPILIIDDEGDEASLNTQFRKGKQSAVYKSIMSLRSALRSHSYIAYTATPQANLLIDGIDNLSPDFGALIYPGSGYCGGSVFFGERIKEFVRPINPQDEDAGRGIITESMRKAIAIFLVGAAIRHRRGDGDWHSMLIHNSSLKREHSQAYEAVKQLISSWKTKMTYLDSDPEKLALLSLFKSAYDDLNLTVINIPNWDDLKNDLSREIWQVEVWIVNSLPAGRDPMTTSMRLPNNIFVGGNMLGRGLTIRGLAVTYITRRAKKETNADTLEQRARWFGYKEKYLDTCRIFLTEELRSNYAELLRHEDDFWEALSRNMRQGIPIRDWPRMFVLDPEMSLNPTRQSVASYKHFRKTGWATQRRLIEETRIADSNVRSVREFFVRHQAKPKLYGESEGGIEHTVIENCPTDVVIKELLENVVTDGSDWDNSYFKEYLTRLYLAGSLPSLDVLLMRNGKIEGRKKDGAEINPFVGRSSNYLGDQNIHGNKPQFQVHIIGLREKEGDPTGVTTTSFALYLPENNPRFDLDFVVRGQENENSRIV